VEAATASSRWDVICQAELTVRYWKSMKPTKNRVFCKDCGRSKMLFETEKKADTFLRFNSDEIEEEAGYKPERCYFCTYCGGWHVTSKKELAVKSRTEKILDLYEQEKEKKALAKAQQKVLKREQKALFLAKKMEEEALIHAQKVEDLKKSLSCVENYIALLENSQENKNKCIEILDMAFVELENSKSCGVVFKGSLKRMKEAAEKLTILGREIKQEK
jgi:hypothetical protein